METRSKMELRLRALKPCKSRRLMAVPLAAGYFFFSDAAQE
jgi:hypothetical protein